MTWWIQSGERPYSCSVCYTMLQELQNSMILQDTSVHTRERNPYCCSHCGREFGHLNKLRMHEKPFQCKHRENSFSLSVYLKKHEKVTVAKDLVTMESRGFTGERNHTVAKPSGTCLH